MVRIRNHGGMCCGARHIYDFVDDVPEEMRRTKNLIQRSGKGRLYEVILNYNQVRFGYLDPLLEMGFRLVTKFKNSTGGTCYVLHYAATGYKTDRSNGKRYTLCNKNPSPWVGA